MARRAGASARSATKSTATDPVTAADRAVERLIGRLLREHRPDDRLLGEEFGDDRAGRPGVRGRRDRAAGCVDPIDGTVNYVYGLPHYAVSIAAELDGQVVAGVVRNAATGEEWTAIRGGGAWRGSTRLTGSPVTELAQALVATGFGYDAARRAHQAGVLAVLLPRVRDIRRFGAASLDLCFAAEGRFDAYFEKGLGAWDHAAGGSGRDRGRAARHRAARRRRPGRTWCWPPRRRCTRTARPAGRPRRRRRTLTSGAG